MKTESKKVRRDPAFRIGMAAILLLSSGIVLTASNVAACVFTVINSNDSGSAKPLPTLMPVPPGHDHIQHPRSGVHTIMLSEGLVQ